MKCLSISLLIALAGFCFAGPAPIYDIPLKDIDGRDTSLKQYEGKVLLIVNVASQCGLTPQYKELQELQEKYADKGFTVLGFPSNDFGGQEPGTNEEIKEFCSTKYSVTFPLFDKVHVKGESQHPLYRYLTGPEAGLPGNVKWNFGKFLIDRDGKPVKRFAPPTRPLDKEVTSAIDELLSAKGKAEEKASG